MAECVIVTSAVDGAEFQVITLSFPKNKSLQAIAVVPKASVLSVSETRVVLIATVSKLDNAVLAPAPPAAQVNTPLPFVCKYSFSAPSVVGKVNV